MLQTIGHIIFLVVFVYLAAGIVYLGLLVISGLLRKKKHFAPAPHKNRIALLIPAFKEDGVILDTALKAKQHNYPAERFEVFVIADKLQDQTIGKLRAIPVNVIKVQFETSTKARSLNAAMQHISAKAFEYVMILDADNIMATGCLEQVNAAFENLPAGTVDDLMKPENKEKLVDILQYHVYVGSLKTDLMQDGQTLNEVNGGNIAVSKGADGKVKLNNTANIIASIPASNGIIHVIDAVLLPPAK